MDLKHVNSLRALEAAVRLGSFRAAGEELCITAAAVGQHVKKLEDRLGFPLRRAARNGFVPTKTAVRAAERLASGFGHLSEAIDILTQRTAASRLALTAVPTLAGHWLAPRIPDFLRRHPGLDLRIDSTHTIHVRADPEFDFALRYGPEAPDGWQRLNLFPEYLVPVCVPELATRIGVVRAPDQLHAVPLLHVDSETSDTEWLTWRQWAERFGYAPPDPHAGTRFTHATLALQSMYAGHGIHLAQLSIVLADLLSNRLVAPFGRAAVKTGYPYRLICFGTPTPSPLHADFIEWMTLQAHRTASDMRSFVESGSEG